MGKHLAGEEGPIHGDGDGRREVLGEQCQIPRREPLGATPYLQEPACHRGGHARTDERQADGALVAEQQGELAQIGLRPRVRDAQREQPLDALGGAQGREQPRPSAPVVADPGRSLDRQGVEHGEHVRGQLLLFVAIGGRLAPAVTAQVRGDDPEALGKRRDHVAPLPPVLRPAVDEQDGGSVLGAGQRDVHPQPAGVHILVPDARQRWGLGHHRLRLHRHGLRPTIKHLSPATEYARLVEQDEPDTPPPTIKVEVVTDDGEEIAFRSGKLPNFSERAGELGESLNYIASSLRGHLSDLAQHEADGWDLNQVALSFSISLGASGGVIIAQASTTAGFQATLTWQRSTPA
jgi:Trypsin-co-occurring domain 1